MKNAKIFGVFLLDVGSSYDIKPPSILLILF